MSTPLIRFVLASALLLPACENGSDGPDDDCDASACEDAGQDAGPTDDAANPMDGASDDGGPSADADAGDAEANDGAVDAAPMDGATRDGEVAGDADLTDTAVTDGAMDATSGDAADAAGPDTATPDSGTPDAANEGGVQPGPSTPWCGAAAPTYEILLQPGAGGSVRVSADRELIFNAGTWTLWEPSTGKQIAAGYGDIPGRPFSPDGVGDIVGDKFIVSADGGADFQLRSSVDGHLLTTITATQIVHRDTDGEEPRLAVDGSYIFQNSAASLQAWSPSGQLLFRRAGDYSRARVYAGPSGLLVGKLAPPSTTFERVALDGTPTTSAAFTGSFVTWFADGERFFASDGDALRIYSKDVVPQQLLQNLGGSNFYDDTLWGNGTLFYMGGKVYRVGTAEPIATVITAAPGQPLPEPIRMPLPTAIKAFPLTVQGGKTVLRIVDLRGNDLRTRDVEVPSFTWSSSFAPGAGDSFAFERYVFTGAAGSEQRTLLGCASVTDVAGAPSGRLALGHFDGLVRVFDMTQPAAPTLESEFKIAEGDVDLEMSSDGNHLFVITAATTRLLALPSGTLEYQWPYPWSSGGSPYSYSVARDVQRVAFSECDDTGCRTHVQNFAGTDVMSPLTSSQPRGKLSLSPNGTLLATGSIDGSTTMYENGAFLSGSAHELIGWRDDTSLVLQSNSSPEATIITNKLGEQPQMISQSIYQPVVLNNELLYSTVQDRLYSAVNGMLVWQGNATGVSRERGTFAGRYRVVNAYGGVPQVVAQAYR